MDLVRRRVLRPVEPTPAEAHLVDEVTKVVPALFDADPTPPMDHGALEAVKGLRLEIAPMDGVHELVDVHDDQPSHHRTSAGVLLNDRVGEDVVQTRRPLLALEVHDEGLGGAVGSCTRIRGTAHLARWI